MGIQASSASDPPTQGLHVDGFMTKPVALDKFLDVVKSVRRAWLAELILSPIA